VQDCWLPTPLACFPFTSPPVRHRVPPDSACALQVDAKAAIGSFLDIEGAFDSTSTEATKPRLDMTFLKRSWTE